MLFRSSTAAHAADVGVVIGVNVRSSTRSRTWANIADLASVTAHVLGNGRVRFDVVAPAGG